MKNKLIAFLTTGLMMTSAVALPPVEAADKSDKDPVIGVLPDWVPQDFAGAMQFYNTHGKTYVADNVICTVRPMRNYPDGNYSWAIAGSMTMLDTPASGKEKIYELEIPEKPDPEDRSAVRAYEDYCDSIGLYSHDYSFFESYAESQTHFQFDVNVYRVSEGYNLQVLWSEKQNGSFRITETFNFENNDGTTVETDYYGWLPDSAPEFNEFMTLNGKASVHDNLVVYCSDVNYSTGASLKTEQSGSGKVEEIMESSCSPFELIPLDGSASPSVKLYKPVADGDADVKWTIGREWSSEAPYDITYGSYTIKDDCSVIVDRSPDRKGSTIFRFVDRDTGELIDIPEGSNFYLQKDTVEEPYTGEIFNLTSNPLKVDSINAYDPHCSYTCNMNTSAGRYDFPEFEITTEGTNFVEVTCKLKLFTELPENATRITLYDRDTGELIPSEWLKNHMWGFGTDIRFKNDNTPGGWMYTGPICIIHSNPCNYTDDDLAKLYKQADYFEFLCDDQPAIIMHKNGAMDLVFKTKLTLVDGNLNGDSDFNIADAVTLKKWLLNDSDVEIYDWWKGDLDFDDQLTGFDLCLMMQELVDKTPAGLVEPDEVYDYRMYARVVADDLKMYLGPAESYGVVASIPKDALIQEIGTKKNISDWMYTQYNDQYGWVKTFDKETNTQTIFFEVAAKKPVIYLYPEEETDVHVELELTEADLSTTYPKYNNGWDVTAYPDGSLHNKADGTHHRYLFWDAVNCRTRFDFSKGFCVAGGDTESFLREKLTYMGLTEDEMNEFIVYWLPLMEHNKYNLISFQGEAYTSSAKLDITPKPDSLLRIFMTYVPLEEAVDIEPQQLETFERKGFTVVEWGGSEIK